VRIDSYTFYPYILKDLEEVKNVSKLENAPEGKIGT